MSQSSASLDLSLGENLGNSKLLGLEEASNEIKSGKVLWIAADEEVLKQLPKGNWIGGSIPYFMAQQGGETTRDKVFLTELPPGHASRAQIKFYDNDHIQNVMKEAPEDGFSIIMIPAFSDVHLSYGKDAPMYEDMFLKPIAGWITGIHLDDLGKTKPVVFNGSTGESSHDRAIVMHITLKPNKVAHIGIVNTQIQGDGDTFKFPDAGFSVSDCLINDQPGNLAEYLIENKIDTQLPLVADYSGAMINVSIQAVDEENKNVALYAPVFEKVEYRLAKPLDDYMAEFQSQLPGSDSHVIFSCNCILNYLYLGLEGKKTANITGPMTFGEVAYQLLNQTMVYMSIDDF